MTFLRRTNSDASDASFNWNSQELEEIIKGTLGHLGCDDVDTPPPFDNSDTSFSENQDGGGSGNDPALRMSFAKWTEKDKQSWTCAICTFANEPLHLTCGACGKAKGAKPGEEDPSHFSSSVGAPLASHGRVSLSNNTDFDEDQFLEQLRQERHNEVLELQQSILSQAAMELSLRDNSQPSRMDHSESSMQDYSQRSDDQSRRTMENNQAASAQPPRRTTSQLTHHSGAPRAPLRSPIRPAESAVYAAMSEAEEAEMRKILAMGGVNAPDDSAVGASAAASTSQSSTMNDSSQSTSMRRGRSAWDEAEDDLMAQKLLNGVLSTSTNGCTTQTSSGMDDSTQGRQQGMSASYATASGGQTSNPPSQEMMPRPSNISPKNRRTRLGGRNGQPQARTSQSNTRPGQIERAQSTDVDEDILAKIAARSRDNGRDLSGLTSMAASATPAPAVRPGAYQNRPGAQPVRNESLAVVRKTSSNTDQTGTERAAQHGPARKTTSSPVPIASRNAAEDEKIRNEMEDTKPAAKGKAPKRIMEPRSLNGRATSGLALDDEMLQIIVNSGAESPTSPKTTSRSKDRAGMLQKAWQATESKPSLPATNGKDKKGGNLKKAAKGLMKTFRKNK